ncbi:MAG: OpgC domain-containing protein [Pseudomonadota bacterium]
MTTSDVALQAIKRKKRDVRLDFFRGMSLIIIFIAHVHGNIMWWYIPARFGLSDAADVFVFCSGLASGFAFYRTFDSHGFGVGTMRVGYRVWQVYWSHILVTLVAAGVCIFFVTIFSNFNYLGRWGLLEFVNNIERALPGLMILQIQPGRSDILPMYLTLLAAMPVIIGLANIHRLLPVTACLMVYFFVQITDANLQHAHGQWFFNPLAWQILFFGGFMFSSGILPAPKPNRIITVAALTYIVLSVFISYPTLLQNYEELRLLRSWLIPPDHKTNLSILRVIHFFALAYLFAIAWTGLGQLLQRPAFEPIVFMGQHSLAIFMSGIIASIIGDVILTQWGYHFTSWTVVNVGGVLALYGVAHIAKFFQTLQRSSPA